MISTVDTERLHLRLPRESDAETLLKIRNSAFVMKFNNMRAWDVERMRAEIREEIKAGSALYIERREDGALLGGIWIEEDDIRYRVRSKCLSYYLDERYARQGYMKEALAETIRALFENDPELELVAARVFAGNTASERLLLSLGFTYEGCIRRCVRTNDGETFDDIQFSLFREELR